MTKTVILCISLLLLLFLCSCGGALTGPDPQPAEPEAPVSAPEPASEAEAGLPAAEEPIAEEPPEEPAEAEPSETPEEPEPELADPSFFDETITFTREYFEGGDCMPYALYTPSSAAERENAGLIVWLHGVGELGAGEEAFCESGLLDVMNHWSLEGFHAYVLCPHLTSKWNAGHWNTTYAVNNLQALLDYILATYPIDPEQVVITGHSMGGHGAEYMAWNLPEYFSKLVVLSGFNAAIPHAQITVPTIGYVGSAACGEVRDSITYMDTIFANDFGAENLFHLEVSHTDLSYAAFHGDADGNCRSDLIEWMFAEEYSAEESSAFS